MADADRERSSHDCCRAIANSNRGGHAHAFTGARANCDDRPNSKGVANANRNVGSYANTVTDAGPRTGNPGGGVHRVLRVPSGGGG